MAEYLVLIYEDEAAWDKAAGRRRGDDESSPRFRGAQCSRDPGG